MLPTERKAGPNGQGERGHKIQGMAFQVLCAFKVQRDLGEVQRPKILGGRRPLRREGTRLSWKGIHLESMVQEEHVQKTEAPWNLREVTRTRTKELSSSKTPEETLEVWTATVWGMPGVGGDHGGRGEDKCLGTVQFRLLSPLQREAHLQREHGTIKASEQTCGHLQLTSHQLHTAGLQFTALKKRSCVYQNCRSPALFLPSSQMHPLECPSAHLFALNLPVYR